MQVITIVATFNDMTGQAPVVGVGAEFFQAQDRVNALLARHHAGWIHLNLPDGDASVIRSTPLGNIRFSMQRHNL